MKIFNVLDPELSVQGSYFLEASAGTGKTFAIEHLVARLIADGVATIEQILVMTFTRAATRELKIRIQNRLRQTLFSAPDRERALRIEKALLCFEQANIVTIHAFCQRLLTQFPLESHAPFGGKEGESGEELRKAVDQFLREEIDSRYSGAELERLIRSFHGDVERLKKRLIDGANRLPKERSSVDVSRQIIEKRLIEIGSGRQIEINRLLSDFTLLSPLYKKMGGEEHQSELLLFFEILQKRELSLAQLEELIGKESLFIEGWTSSNQKKRGKPPSPDLLYDPSIFDELHEKIWPLLKKLRDAKQIFSRVANDFSAYWHKRKEEKGVLTSDDLLRSVGAALAYPEFCSLARKEVKALIVDEFQDTDPLQWDILHTLFFQPEPIDFIALVGDPKQSIYAFRSADIYTYLKAAQAASEKRYLQTNFRSQKLLIDALNLLFSYEPNWLSLPREKTSLPYLPVASADSSSTPPFSDGRGSLHFFIAEGEIGREKKWPPSAIEADLFFSYIAAEIKELIEKEGKKFGDFAVLVKDRYQAERLFQYFTALSFPSSVRRAEKLTEGELFSAFEHLFSALADHQGKGAHLFFTGPFVGWSRQEFLSARENGALLQGKALLASLKDLLEEKGLSLFLSAFFQTKFAGITPFEQLAQQESLLPYDEAMQISELLLSRLGEGSITPRKVLLFLRRIKRLFVEEEPLLRPRPSLERGTISIMTLHMSKGLEFDVVFALGVASRHLSDQENEELLEELDAEKMRQLYVALTRAKQRVYVPLFFSKEESSPDLGEGAPIELFFQKWFPNTRLTLPLLLPVLQSLGEKVDLGITLLDEKKEVSPITYSEERSLLSPPPAFTPHFPSVHLYSFTQLAQGEKEELPFRKKEISSPLPRGKETGIFLHALFQEIFDRRLFPSYKRKARRELILTKTAASPFYEHADLIVQMIEKSLTYRIEPEGFSLEEVDLESVQTEMEFSFASEEGFVQGAIDLVLSHQGKVYLFDWKSNEVETEQDAEECMQRSSYFLQAAIYREAIERYYASLSTPLIFGKAVYVFLRAPFFITFTPERFVLREVLFS